MFPNDIEDAARRIIQTASARQLWITTAESCTGGLVGAALTAIAGSSAVYDRGFITYSNAAKTDLLGVPTDLLATDGAVSEATARAMAQGALRAAGAQIAVAVTGIAGPGGGSDDKPVGLVHFGLATAGGDVAHRQAQFGNLGRQAVRMSALRMALNLIELGFDQTA